MVREDRYKKIARFLCLEALFLLLIYSLRVFHPQNGVLAACEPRLYLKFGGHNGPTFVQWIVALGLLLIGLGLMARINAFIGVYLAFDTISAVICLLTVLFGFAANSDPAHGASFGEFLLHIPVFLLLCLLPCVWAWGAVFDG